MRLRSGLLIGIFGLIVVLLGGWFFTLATALLTYLALLEFFRIAELPEMMTLTFCLGFANQKDFLLLFENLWNKLLLKSKKFKSFEVLHSPFKLVEEPEIQIGIAWRSETRNIPFSESLNKISGDIICPYPPGIPLLVPGEKINIDKFNWINNQSLCNKDLVNFKIRVI